MNVLIAGVSGFIGEHLIRALHKKKTKITALTRDPRKLEGRGVDAIQSLGAIPDECLRLENNYIELASDWSFMIPKVEMAKKSSLDSGCILFALTGRGAR